MRTRSYNQNEAIYTENDAILNYVVWFENKRSDCNNDIESIGKQ